MTNTTLARACEPRHNVTVTASAGTGKTYLLVSRLLRLLLEGASPAGLLAISFTRKAAAEMQNRLYQRLHDWMWLNDKQLAADLQGIEVTVTPEVLSQARGLYETVMTATQPVRITTFHAFCQDLLRRFPFEAEVSAGFELANNTGLLMETAWDALWQQATKAPDSDRATVLQLLLSQCGNIENTRLALLQFLSHRSDWWAMTDQQPDPAGWASQHLARQLQLDTDRDPAESFFSPVRLRDIALFRELLLKNPTATNQDHAQQLAVSLDDRRSREERLAAMSSALLTKSHGTVRQRTASKRHMNETEQQQFIELNTALAEQLIDVKEQLAKRFTWQLSTAWYQAGAQMLTHYQELKKQQRLLDFTDLEWYACKLLNHSDNSHWVQYKLDQRIDHILVDEFQDTNPTQWRLLLPLLEELAAARQEKQRSVFLVGDEKQSIYRFRRAEPRLFAAAQLWMQQHLDAVTVPLNKSWRSSPAIIDFMNRVFSQEMLQHSLPSFVHHDTHLSLPGFVEFLPLVQVGEESPVPGNGLRYPLHEPRPERRDARHEQEGHLIALRIRQLIEQQTVVGDDDQARPLDYSDIMILVRKRTHLGAYEKALREAGIPYLGGGRDSVLDHQESHDITALLNILITPFDNLALATVLRSPLFACTDEDLMCLARSARNRQHPSTWYHCLLEKGDEFPANSSLGRAGRLLPHWMSLADHVPVHDLLDRIYHEGEIMQRYHSAAPIYLQQRIRSSLEKFLELALEIDSGRYPSLGRFLNRLQRLRQYDQDAVDSPADHRAGQAVRIMTVHAAKGLESPVVFAADTGFSPARSKSHHALVNWPAGQPQPDLFLLAGRKHEQDRWTRARLEEAAQQERRESANLLYVAVSRARQMLFISGCQTRQGNQQDSWYEILARAFEQDIAGHGGIVATFGRPATLPAHGVPTDTDNPPALPDELLQDAPVNREPTSLVPSRQDAEMPAATDSENQLRGRVIHRLLERLTRSRAEDNTDILHQTAAEFGFNRHDATLRAWFEEALALLRTASLQALLKPDVDTNIKAYNEVPLTFFHDGLRVVGIIDRLLVTNSEALVIDYKTHQHARPDNLAELAADSRAQLELYAAGIKKLWPDHTVRRLLVFTACAAVYEFK